ncbi:MAG: transcription termination/antitermination protein NusG [Eubacterium sp.]|nr:transcription termination/antitermination protein NusG [Eubacterium sp.]SEF81048.1 transcription antitermination protein nusG [Eubacterium ruminantium]
MSEINEEAVEQAVEPAVEPVKRPTSVKQVEDTEPHWYVVHTYSGYENKVKADIEKTIENRKLQGQMLEVMVPLQDVVETKNGVKKTVSKKMFPGYVLVHMIKNDVTWYVVRNTRGVTGFVGPGSEPVPLTEAEMKKLGVKLPSEIIDIDVEIGDVIKVVSGAWEGTDGTIKSINAGKQTVTIDVDIFGRSTSVEIGLGDIEKL